MRPGGAKANAELLDHGTLHVARFDADGSGRWLPLLHGQGPLTASNGFADQGAVVIRSRQASDLLGATKMDRPEWFAVDARTGEVYCTLTNNSGRGTANLPAPDAANPRASNTMGEIIRWKEDGDFDAGSFRWNHFVLAGDPANERAEAKGNIQGDLFACPDGLAFDARGVLWIQTDAHAREMNKGEFRNIGNNQMLACDLASGEVRRFLTGPVNCEVTGCTLTPDGTTMFINIQHPGETAGDRSDPAEPRRFSNWPDYRPDGRPAGDGRDRKVDGGVIGMSRSAGAVRLRRLAATHAVGRPAAALQEPAAQGTLRSAKPSTDEKWFAPRCAAARSGCRRLPGRVPASRCRSNSALSSEPRCQDRRRAGAAREQRRVAPHDASRAGSAAAGSCAARARWS